jgi:hypothetical protein
MSQAIDNQAEPITAVIPRGFGGFVFDAVLEEEHTSEIEVTENPVETGASISDHAYIKPDVVRMVVGVTNHQLVPRDDGFGLYDARIKNAFRALRDLQRTREPFDVQTGLHLYRNMVCKSIHTIQDKDSANAVSFVCELREVIIVHTQIVSYPPRKSGKPANQASKKKEGGEKQGKEVGPKEQKKGSFLHKGINLARGAL